MKHSFYSFLSFLLSILIMCDQVALVDSETAALHSKVPSVRRADPSRQLYDFVAPTIRDCQDSGLLLSCSIQDTATLYTGACDSALQQRYTDVWCYPDPTSNNAPFCCGTSAKDCCETNSGYMAAIFIAVVLILSPIILLFACAYGRCCPFYSRLWNAKSNRGCGRNHKLEDINQIEKNLKMNAVPNDEI
jgi:hypothetical protein